MDPVILEARRRRERRQKIIALAVAGGVLALLAFGGGIALFTSGILFNTDPDLAAVRAWLKENTDTGHWEEVKWWPGRPYKSRLNWDDVDLIGDPNFKPKPARFEMIRLCRLRYREGGSIHDQIFEIRNGKAEKGYSPWTPGPNIIWGNFYYHQHGTE